MIWEETKTRWKAVALLRVQTECSNRKRKELRRTGAFEGKISAKRRSKRGEINMDKETERASESKKMALVEYCSAVFHPS